MKLSVRPENPMERVVMALGLAPVTLVDTHMAFLRARAIMAATKLGIFEALAGGPLPADDIAARCATAPAASASLLNALVGSGYLRFRAGRYALAPVARKWLLAAAPHSVRDKVLFEFFEWSIVEGLEDFVRTGRASDLHQRSSSEQWAAYQRAMRALSGIAAPEIVRRTPMPSNPAAMLDIGGSHGFISVAMCRRYPSLRAVVLDLPAAIEHAAPILARENMGERVVHRPGNALEDDLGDAQWDFVYMAQFVHHFDGSTNRALMRRVARGLKPGGIVCVVELIRPESPAATGQVGALLDLYFALTSQAGTWSIEEMTAWQREAGLVPLRPVHLRTVPGAAAITARRDTP